MEVFARLVAGATILWPSATLLRLQRHLDSDVCTLDEPSEAERHWMTVGDYGGIARLAFANETLMAGSALHAKVWIKVPRTLRKVQIKLLESMQNQLFQPRVAINISPRDISITMLALAKINMPVVTQNKVIRYVGEW